MDPLLKNELEKIKSIAITTFQKDLRSSDFPKLKDIFSHDKIWGELYLGPVDFLIQTTHLTLEYQETIRDSVVEQTYSNQYNFETVITVCPFSETRTNYPNITEEIIAADFSENNIEWLRPGRYISDNKIFRYALVFNATFPNLSSQIEDEFKSVDDIECFNEMREIIERLPVEDWFERTFEKIDQAILGKRKVLVHCGKGVSRSPTLIAAYLINRCRIPLSRVFCFLIKKRNPVFNMHEFMDFLEYYQHRLGVKD